MKIGRSFSVVIIFVLFLTGHEKAEAASASDINAAVRDTLGLFYRQVPGGHELAERAVGVLVFPTVIKAGMGFGAKAIKIAPAEVDLRHAVQQAGQLLRNGLWGGGLLGAQFRDDQRSHTDQQGGQNLSRHYREGTNALKSNYQGRPVRARGKSLPWARLKGNEVAAPEAFDVPVHFGASHWP